MQTSNTYTFPTQCWHIAYLIICLCLATSCHEATPDSSNSLPITKNSNLPGPQNRSATQRIKNQKYLVSLPANFNLPVETDEVGWRILSDYGAVYVARGGVTNPPIIRFKGPADTAQWQAGLKIAQTLIGGIKVELQQPAMEALFAAREEAHKNQSDITPRGADSARRSYEETVVLWNSRVHPALEHWVAVGRLNASEATRLRALPASEQVPEVLKLESQGIYFSKDMAKSILYSVAAPGSSQHISLLALDVKEHENPSIRTLLMRHGWFQTVVSDLPHFTFLGVTEEQMSELGLKRVKSGDRIFWVPALAAD